jgi:hypothetical protein
MRISRTTLSCELHHEGLCDLSRWQRFRGANVKDVTVVPKPLQKPHPKIYMVGTSEASFIAVGTRGVSIAAGGPVPYAVYAPGIDGYKKACVHGVHPVLPPGFTTSGHEPKLFGKAQPRCLTRFTPISAVPDNGPVRGRERRGGLLRYYYRDAA